MAGIVRFAKDGVYVVDVGKLRSLRLGSPEAPEQALVRVDDFEDVLMGYVRISALGLAYAEKPTRALMVGLGAGVFARMLARLAPEVTVDAVEIAPAVVEAARACFELEKLEGDKLHVHVDDAARFLRRTRRRFDLVFLDAFSKSGAVDALSDESFYEDVRARLSLGGVAILNLASPPEEERRLLEAFTEVFASVEVYRVPDEGNLLCFGQARPRSLGQLERRVRCRR